MCDMITQSLSSVSTAVWSTVDASYKVVEDSVNCLGRRVEDLTNAVLPPTAARIAQKMIFGLPITVAALTLPTYVHLTAGAVYGIVHVAYSLVGEKDAMPLKEAHYKPLFTGYGTAFLYSAAKETADLAMRVKGANIVSIALKLFATSFFYSLLAKNPAPRFAPPAPTPGPVPAPATASFAPATASFVPAMASGTHHPAPISGTTTTGK